MADLKAATGPTELVSATFGANLDIVAFAELTVMGDPCLPRSCFGDDHWDFATVADIPAYARSPNLLTVDWATVSSPVWRLCAKELGLALLQPRVGLDRRLAGARRRRLPPHELARYLYYWRGWFDWLERHDVRRFVDVTQSHCDAWLAGRREEIDAGTLRAEVIEIRRFGDYRQILSLDAYQEGFRPWGATSASTVAGWRHPRENTTSVIPDEVFGPLLAAALFLVQVAGPDVVAAQAEWRQLHQPQVRGGSIDDRLARHLEGLRRSGQSLPELHGAHLHLLRGRGALDETDPLHRVNLSLIARQIGAYHEAITTTAYRRAVVETALQDLGCSGGGLTSPVTLVADPANPDRRQPWHEPFSPYDLEDLVQLVHTACYVAVAALSGLRRSELAEMRRGCIRAEELANGKLRYRIHSKLIKGMPFGGQEECWTVIEEVAQAFSLVESLTVSDQPFARIRPASRFPKLVRWTNGPGADAFLAPIPAWQIGNRQFRRTLARLLGFRPHGVIAGKIHLKHVSVVTSEGYYGRAGSSAAAFLAEIEQQTAVARMETTKRIYRDWAAGRPTAGPGRIELMKLFSGVHADIARFEGSVVDSDRRLEELLRRQANTLHVGPLNNCWFVDPTRAHCLKQAGRTDSATPLIGMCEPTRCANATIHPEHVPVWFDSERHTDKLLASPRVPEQEKERLALEKRRVHAIVEAASAEQCPR